MNLQTCQIVRRNLTQKGVGLILVQNARSRSLATNTTSQDTINQTPADPKKTSSKPKKTMAQIDEEIRLKMEGRAGDGGDAGLELENGKPVSMKRSVRDNMFRYI